MASRQTREPGTPGANREALLARRARRRRQIRRRRFVAGGSLLAAIALVAGAVTVLGGSRAHSHAATRTSAGQRGKRHGQGRAPNSAPQKDWTPHTGPVPILEYHVLGEAPADAPYPELYVTRPDFHSQLHWLDQHDYEAVTLEQVEAAWYEEGTLPPKPVVLSFDDGYRPQFTFALPQLREHGWAGVLNLKAEGSDLYKSNVEAMIGAGWELASHTIDHSDLTALDTAELKREVAGSRAILRREYGVPVMNFCYPAGEYDATVIAAVRAAGYTGAATEVRGYADREEPYELARFEILGSDGVTGLAADFGESH